MDAVGLRLAPGRKSEILTADMLMQLGSKVSPLMRLREWEVIFGINTDGVSLHTFYNNTRKYNPTIILVKDTHGRVFGGFASEQWHQSKHFYGTGESFLFSFRKSGTLDVFRWTAANDMIMLSDMERLALGGGYDSCLGIWG